MKKLILLCFAVLFLFGCNSGSEEPMITISFDANGGYFNTEIFEAFYRPKGWSLKKNNTIVTIKITPGETLNDWPLSENQAEYLRIENWIDENGNSFSSETIHTQNTTYYAYWISEWNGEKDTNYFSDKIDNNTINIYSAAQFAAFADIVNNGNNMSGKTILLMNNLWLGGEWMPIGFSDDTSFQGTFDGQNKTIDHLYIDNENLDYSGLFGKIGANGIVKNINLTRLSILKGIYSGGIVGKNEGLIENCHSFGTVYATEAAGGVVGNNSGKIKRSSNVYPEFFYTSIETEDNLNVGGIAGFNEGNIIDCKTNPEERIEGGYLYITFDANNCAMFSNNSSLLIERVRDNDFVTLPETPETVLDGESTFLGWFTDDGIKYEEGKITVSKDMTFRGRWLSTWDGVSRDSAYILEQENSVYNNVIKIYTASQLAGLSEVKSLYGVISIENDIDLANHEWTPIGTKDSYFCCNIKGNSRIIYNLKITKFHEYAGLFGYINSNPFGQTGVKNLGVENIDINISAVSNYMDAYVGGLTGYCLAGDIYDCYTTGNIILSYTKGTAGGLIGNHSYGDINSCYSTASITAGKDAGGIAGESGAAKSSTNVISNSYSTGNVYSYNGNAGGIVGDAFHVSIYESYSTGNVTGKEYAGGIFGKGLAYDKRTISDCYSSGQIQSLKSDAGGIAGNLYIFDLLSSHSEGKITAAKDAHGLSFGYYLTISKDSYFTGEILSNYEEPL